MTYTLWEWLIVAISAVGVGYGSWQGYRAIKAIWRKP